MKRKRLKKLLHVLFALLPLWASAQSQNVVVRAGFVNDSLRVGDVVPFYLSAKYPQQLNILFPDTAFNFSPFEFKSKTYFPTRTQGGISYDSTVYYLTTFEVDSIQSLALPVFQISPQDSITYPTNRDSIALQQMITKLPDSLNHLPIRATFDYQPVPYQFNYQFWIIILAILFLIAAMVWFLFGKTLQRYFVLKRMQKAHQQFIVAYNGFLAQTQNTYSTVTTASAFSLWKRYMEQLNRKPYTKLTSREIIAFEKDDALKNNLQKVDSAVYGYNTQVVDSLEHLRSFAEQRFAQKLEEVKHG